MCHKPPVASVSDLVSLPAVHSPRTPVGAGGFSALCHGPEWARRRQVVSVGRQLQDGGCVIARPRVLARRRGPDLSLWSRA
jgi:hypothetical protein